SPLLLPVEDSHLHFVPFHTGFLSPLLCPARTAVAHQPSVDLQHGQLGRGALGLAFNRTAVESSLGLRFGTGTQTLGEPVEGRVVGAGPPLGGQGGGLSVGGGGGEGEGQPLFQSGGKPLARLESPALAHRTAPATAAGIVTVEDGEFNRADAGVQVHHRVTGVHGGPAAVGEKPGRARLLPSEVPPASAAGQTRASPLRFELRCRVRSGRLPNWYRSWSCSLLRVRRLGSQTLHGFSMVVLSRCAPFERISEQSLEIWYPPE